MGWKYYNPNKKRSDAGDCVIRALTLALGEDWQTVHSLLCKRAAHEWEMPSANRVWIGLLEERGFYLIGIPNTCEKTQCYTISQFCKDNPNGLYVVGTGEHVVTVIDGTYYDTYDSGNKIPIYCLYRKEN